VLKKRLRQRQLTNEIDLDLAAELIDGDELQRRRHRDSRVVDQAVQPGRADGLLDGFGRVGHVVRVGDVQHDGPKVL